MATSGSSGAGLEVLAPEHEQARVLHRDHVGRARLVVDHRHLAEEAALAQDGEDDLAAVLRDEDDLDLTRRHEVERVAGIVLEHDDAALGIAPLAGQLGERGEIGSRRGRQKSGTLRRTSMGDSGTRASAKRKWLSDTILAGGRDVNVSDVRAGGRCSDRTMRTSVAVTQLSRPTSVNRTPRVTFTGLRLNLRSRTSEARSASEYRKLTAVCACGNSFETRSTATSIHVEVCAQCHPYFTGKQRLVDTAGRVDRFRRKYQTEPAAAAPRRKRMEARLRQALPAGGGGRAGCSPTRPVARDPAQLQSLGREHTRLAPIVRLAERLARLENELAQARELAGEADPELAALARADLARLHCRDRARCQAELQRAARPARSARRSRRHRGDPGRDRRRRGRAVRGRSLPHVPALLRAARSPMGADLAERRHPRRSQGSDRRGPWPGGLRPPPPRVGRAPGAAGAGHRDPGPHPHVRGHGRGAARGRRGRREDRAQGPQDRRVSLLRPRRPEREHHRQRGAHHPPADRARGQPAGPEIPASEQAQGAWKCCARGCSTG